MSADIDPHTTCPLESLDPTVATIAHDLERTGLWTTATVWTTTDGVEVSEDDPDASHSETVLAIDYQRIVRLVLDHPAVHPVICPTIETGEPA